MDSPPLYELPEDRDYGLEDEEELLHNLKRQDVELLFVPADRYNQLCLDSEGRTVADGRRFSALAFRQLCSLLGPNLSRLLLDLATNTGPDGNRSRVSLEDAVLVYNTLLKRRFTDLEGKLLLVDGAEGLIEGVVSPTYQKLSNWDMYAAVTEKLRDWRMDFGFHSARLRGRHLSCLLRSEHQVYQIGRDDEFRVGVFFSNSENGDASVRATPAVLRTDGTRMLRPYGRGSRITHTGANFRNRFSRLLEVCAQRAAEHEDYGGMVVSAERDSLGFTEETEYNETRAREISRALMARDLPRAFVRRVVRRSLVQDATGVRRHEDPRWYRDSDWRERSYFHLVAALMVEAAETSMHVRSRAEQLAYSVLSGRVRF